MRKIAMTRYRSFYATMRLVKQYIDGEYIGSIKIDQSKLLKSLMARRKFMAA